jgi:biopolymer transport protein ExbB/TolQ
LGGEGAFTAVTALLTLAGGLIQLGIVAALTWWARWVARRHGSRIWRLLSWLPVLGLLSASFGLVATVVGLLHAFGSIGALPAEQKATALANGISVAMYGTAAGLVGEVACTLVSVVASLVGTVTAPPSPPKT